MSKIKLKLPFDKSLSTADKHSKLFLWAKALVNNAPVNILNEEHHDGVSFIEFENNYRPTPDSPISEEGK